MARSYNTRPKHNYSDEFKKKVADYYQLPKVSFQDIREKFGVSRTELYRILKVFNIKTKTKQDRKLYAFWSYEYLQRKKSAERRGLSFSVSKQYLSDLYYKQNKLCPYSGIEIKFNSKKYASDGNASLDRIDSSKPYIEGNVQWVFRYVNFMKSDMNERDFIALCNKVSEYSKGRFV